MKKMDFESLSLTIFPEVYPPSEDSFLLAKHSKTLKGKILDIGCGCGIQSLINAKNNPENKILGIDKSKIAVENSIFNANSNNLKNAKFLESDLFSNVSGTFDAIIFNPPYLPTSEKEVLNSVENLAYDGGEDGRKVLDIFLNKFSDYLNKKGTLLLLHSSLNNPEKTIEFLDSMSFSTSILSRESFFFEKLFVIKSTRR
ncbi:MAG: methyltransferase [Candidatus ainarchaeum sp.]|nr:methyltransferase [Candidatus ainarchaeum sp.]